MSYQPSAAPPPLPSAKPNSRKQWRWILLGCCLLGFVWIAKVIDAYDPSVNLEAAVRYNHIVIGNMGSKPIKIMGVEVDDRADCTIHLPLTLFTDPNNLEFSARELKVGDEIELVSSCKIIRTTIATDQGSATYSFH
jgi:hypothetical protein